jgi:hypothetical protein
MGTVDVCASDGGTATGTVMWFIVVPVLLFIGLASHDDVTKFWWNHPHAGCHWVYRERGSVAEMGGFAWPLARTDSVLCWQEGRLQ